MRISRPTVSLAAAIAALAIAAPAAEAAGPSPTFATGPDGAPQRLGTASSINEVCLADFDGDGHIDNAAASIYSGGRSVGIARGDGTGHLGPYGNEATYPTGTPSCATADFDGDGRAELVAAGSSSEALTLIEWNGSAFATSTIATGAPVFEVETGDVDGDGNADIVVLRRLGDATEGNIQAFLGDGAGGFVSAPVATVGAPQPLSLRLGDLNGDGRDDAVVWNSGDSSGVGRGGARLLAGADGTFGAPAPVANLSDQFELTDVDGDHHLDILYSNVFVNVLLGDGNGNFTADGTTYPSAGPQPDGFAPLGPVAVADFNGDGIDDIIAGAQNQGDTETNLFAFAGTGSETAPFYSEMVGPIPFLSDLGLRVRTIDAADFDEDGLPDVAAGTFNNFGYVGVLLDTTPVAAANRVPPQITGVATPGKTITCSPGQWTGKPTFTYEWLRNGSPIGGEDTSAYVVRAQDAGSQLACRVTATNNGGSSQATSASVVASAAPVPPANTTAPSVSGEPDYGRTIACAAGDWTAGGTFTYRWLRDGAPIVGAEEAGYEVGKADVGKKLSCRVTVTNPDGSGSASSAAVTATGCIVPGVAGKRLRAAKKAIVKGDCAVGAIRRKPGAKPGRVLRTKPKEGTAAPSGARVDLVVAKRR
ncbi:MAG: FG-GAP-like repeat-containing protein [Solirubrobacterales bacterium]